MTKLIALYRKPSDVAEFDKHYREIHTPLVRQYPGLASWKLRALPAPQSEKRNSI